MKLQSVPYVHEVYFSIAIMFTSYMLLSNSIRPASDSAYVRPSEGAFSKTSVVS